MREQCRRDAEEGRSHSLPPSFPWAIRARSQLCLWLLYLELLEYRG